MNIELSQEQRMIRDLAREFAQNEIAPVAAKYDEAGEFPWDTIKKMGELGLMGIMVPEEYGGAGLDTLFLQFGTEEQKRKYLVPVATGEWIGAYSLTEPESGSDSAALKTRAERQEDVYVINGRKSWVTNGPVANALVLFARTNPDLPKHKGISAFIIETDKPGFTAGKPEHKLGVRATALPRKPWGLRKPHLKPA